MKRMGVSDFASRLKVSGASAANASSDKWAYRRIGESHWAFRTRPRPREGLFMWICGASLETFPPRIHASRSELTEEAYAPKPFSD